MIASFFLACICALIMVVMSLLCPEPLTETKEALVWKSLWEPLRDKGWPGIGNYKLLSALLVIIMIVLYVIFG